MESKRRHERNQIPDEAIGDFAFWLADGLDPRQSFALVDLGRPQVELGVRRHFSLLLSDLSAGGVRLTVHSNLFEDVKLDPFLGHKLLTRFTLLDVPGRQGLSLLLLCEVRHEEQFLNRLETGLQFLAWAERPADLETTIRLQPAPADGVPGLKEWMLRHSEAEQH